jgi:adenine-specific DNA-methyltransferase
LFNKLFANLTNYKYWLLSYNNASFPSKDQLLFLLKQYTDNVKVIEREHVYKVTGKDNKKANKEYLFIAKNPLFQNETAHENSKLRGVLEVH